MSIPIYILAGGKSERFGSDKAHMEVDGIPNWQRIADAFHDVTVLEGTANRLSDIPLRRLPDSVVDCGPMGGLLTALQDAEARDHNVLGLISVDMVGWDPEWLLDLARKCQTAAAYHATIWQPLFASYHVSILDSVRERVEAQELAMWRMLETVNARRVEPPPGWERFRSINEVDDGS